MFNIKDLNDLTDHLANLNVRYSDNPGKDNEKRNPAVAKPDDNSIKSYYTSKKSPVIVNPSQPVPPVVTKPPPATIDVSSLLNKLQQKGLIDLTEDAAKITLESHHPSLKTKHPQVLSLLYDDMPVKCTSCALRFSADQKDLYRSHLDWHFRINSRKKQQKYGPESRGWYQPWQVNIWQEDGFEKKDATESEERTLKEEKVDKVLVDAGEEATLCPECLEGFKLVYSEEEEDEQWFFIHAVKKGHQIYHSQCYKYAK